MCCPATPHPCFPPPPLQRDSYKTKKWVPGERIVGDLFNSDQRLIYNVDEAEWVEWVDDAPSRLDRVDFHRFRSIFVRF